MLNSVPLEDEVGDVLEKAMRRSGLTEESLGERAHVNAGRIRDAVNYRPELSVEELCRLAGALRLNEIGLSALGCGRYPLPALDALPFCVYPLRMPHGIGVVNAYVVAECGAATGILFDTGPSLNALEAIWPKQIKRVSAVFLTHLEAEHAGGLHGVVDRFAVDTVYAPADADAGCGGRIGEGTTKAFGTLNVTAFSTPGHASAHNCYLVEAAQPTGATSLLVSGDLFFAGSIGCAHFCQKQLAANLRRMLNAVPPKTVVAPGHGPMTTAENELRFNPFVV